MKQEWGAEVYPGRTNWASHTDYVMAALGLILGVSSFSFFPFVCLKYGKGNISFFFISFYLVMDNRYYVQEIISNNDFDCSIIPGSVCSVHGLGCYTDDVT